MKRKLITVILALTLVLGALPASVCAATGENISIDDKAVLYTPANDYKSGDCILSSTKTMIRRAAILRGSKLWSQVTNASLRKDATIFGLLLHNFTHSTDGLAYTIKSEAFTGKTEKARKQEFENLLKEHPEGVVVWGKRASKFGEHGILLTGYSEGVFYAADSAYNKGNSSKGIQKWSNTSMYSPLKCTRYWYIKGVNLAKGAPAPAAGQPLKPISAENPNTASTLKISSANKPKSIKKGKKFSISGVVESNYRITAVNVSVIDGSGNAVISQSVNPNSWMYSLSDIDYKVKFGKLDAGTYRYIVSASDEKISSVLLDAAFSVTAKKSKLKIKYYNVPTALSAGKKYSIKGKISSNKKISKVTVQVMDAGGQVKLSASSKPKKKSYNLKKLDNKVKFGKLPTGSYVYKVVARDSAQSKILVEKGFTVL